MSLPPPVIMLQTVDAAPNFEQLLQIGNRHAQQGEMITAEQYYRQAIALNPQAGIAHQNLGEVLRQQRRFDEANQCYRQAIILYHDHDPLPSLSQSSPSSQSSISSPTCQDHLTMNMMSSTSPEAQTYLELAFNAIEQQSWEKAIIMAQQELLQHPDSSEAYRLLGQARQATHQLSQAERCYERAITLDADNAEARVNLGDFYAGQGQLEKAVVAYRGAIAHYQSFPAQAQPQPQPPSLLASEGATRVSATVPPATVPPAIVPPAIVPPATTESHPPQTINGVSPTSEPKVSPPIDRGALLQEAADQVLQGEWAKALALYQQALKLNPDADTYKL
ncbi:MAG: tetratricopeptide repeat protein, partial [Leptolyngbyaceae bacterium]|nr:tetratricopeptide repeat protein [Leptolyngbyaceae bacterium]